MVDAGLPRVDAAHRGHEDQELQGTTSVMKMKMEEDFPSQLKKGRQSATLLVDMRQSQ